MEELLSMNEIKVGQKVSGEVILVQDNLIMLDLHQFAEGKIYINEFGGNVTSFKGVVKVGDQVEAIVKKIDEEHGNILLSRLPLLKEAEDAEMAGLADKKETISFKVEKNVGRGIIGHYKGAEVFVDANQIDLEEVNADDFVGKTIEAKLIRFDDRRNQYVASRRDLLYQARKEAKAAEFAEFKEGAVVTGEVSKIDEHLGIFVKFNYNQGLIRYREVSHTPFASLNDVAKVGDKMEVKIIKIDGNKIDLSRKALIETPFDAFAKEHKISEVLEGKIVQKLPIGAIVELAPYVTALLHANEISWNPNDNTFAGMKIGDTVKAAIISLDAKKKRIGLSLKVLQDNPWGKVKAEVGQQVKATVTEVVAGRYLKVSCLGVDGIINVNEVPMKEKSSKLEDYYTAGDEVDAIITVLDTRMWKLELSIKKYTNRIEREQFEEFMKKEQEQETTITLGDLFQDVLKK